LLNYCETFKKKETFKETLKKNENVTFDDISDILIIEETNYLQEANEDRKDDRKVEIDPFLNENLSLVDTETGFRINKNASDTDFTMVLYSFIDICGLLVESYRKIEILRLESDLHEKKKEKN